MQIPGVWTEDEAAAHGVWSAAVRDGERECADVVGHHPGRSRDAKLGKPSEKQTDRPTAR